ncbi:hypothetical protein KIPB_005727 [Kipferlia bialata]|uniref:Uncharacterized protein n=1 Tax=Kipferlia bialata TaxID=797122 RepID=A0A391P2R4_9EUKA|nr:hypothetical protein KIPB_005727 [Kipferlia bialata]|eukprot:g5727.t1
MSALEPVLCLLAESHGDRTRCVTELRSIITLQMACTTGDAALAVLRHRHAMRALTQCVTGPVQPLSLAASDLLLVAVNSLLNSVEKGHLDPYVLFEPSDHCPLASCLALIRDLLEDVTETVSLPESHLTPLCAAAGVLTASVNRAPQCHSLSDSDISAHVEECLSPSVHRAVDALCPLALTRLIQGERHITSESAPGYLSAVLYACVLSDLHLLTPNPSPPPGLAGWVGACLRSPLIHPLHGLSPLMSRDQATLSSQASPSLFLACYLRSALSRLAPDLIPTLCAGEAAGDVVQAIGTGDGERLSRCARERVVDTVVGVRLVCAALSDSQEGSASDDASPTRTTSIDRAPLTSILGRVAATSDAEGLARLLCEHPPACLHLPSVPDPLSSPLLCRLGGLAFSQEGCAQDGILAPHVRRRGGYNMALRPIGDALVQSVAALTSLPMPPALCEDASRPLLPGEYAVYGVCPSTCGHGSVGAEGVSRLVQAMPPLSVSGTDGKELISAIPCLVLEALSHSSNSGTSSQAALESLMNSTKTPNVSAFAKRLSPILAAEAEAGSPPKPVLDVSHLSPSAPPSSRVSLCDLGIDIPSLSVDRDAVAALGIDVEQSELGTMLCHLCRALEAGEGDADEDVDVLLTLRQVVVRLVAHTLHTQYMALLNDTTTPSTPHTAHRRHALETGIALCLRFAALCALALPAYQAPFLQPLLMLDTEAVAGLCLSPSAAVRGMCVSVLTAEAEAVVARGRGGLSHEVPVQAGVVSPVTLPLVRQVAQGKARGWAWQETLGSTDMATFYAALLAVARFTRLSGVSDCPRSTATLSAVHALSPSTPTAIDAMSAQRSLMLCLAACLSADDAGCYDPQAALEVYNWHQSYSYSAMEPGPSATACLSLCAAALSLPLSLPAVSSVPHCGLMGAVHDLVLGKAGQAVLDGTHTTNVVATLDSGLILARNALLCLQTADSEAQATRPDDVEGGRAYILLCSGALRTVLHPSVPQGIRTRHARGLCSVLLALRGGLAGRADAPMSSLLGVERGTPTGRMRIGLCATAHRCLLLPASDRASECQECSAALLSGIGSGSGGLTSGALYGGDAVPVCLAMLAVGAVSEDTLSLSVLVLRHALAPSSSLPVPIPSLLPSLALALCLHGTARLASLLASDAQCLTRLLAVCASVSTLSARHALVCGSLIQRLEGVVGVDALSACGVVHVVSGVLPTLAREAHHSVAATDTCVYLLSLCSSLGPTPLSTDTLLTTLSALPPSEGSILFPSLATMLLGVVYSQDPQAPGTDAILPCIPPMCAYLESQVLTLHSILPPSPALYAAVPALLAALVPVVPRASEGLGCYRRVCETCAVYVTRVAGDVRTMTDPYLRCLVLLCGQTVNKIGRRQGTDAQAMGDVFPQSVRRLLRPIVHAIKEETKGE